MRRVACGSAHRGSKLKTDQTWVILNDIQIPFHDERVLQRLVLPFIDELHPNGVILNGDIVDCYSISDFDHDPLTRASLDREIRLAGKLMERLARIGSRRIWIGGNHEDRLRRMVWKQPALLSAVDKASREKIVHLLDFPEMFGLAEYGFEWRPYGGFEMLGKLMVTHGSMVSKHSAQSARSHLDKYGTSVLIGHTHRGGIFYKRDVKGVHAAYENFCLCRLDPEYVQHPNWQQGFSVVHLGSNGFFNVQQIPILPGNQFFYGGTRVRG
jgi:predicted phosphodiesterase